MQLSRTTYLVLLSIALFIDLVIFISGTWTICTVILTIMVLPFVIQMVFFDKSERIRFW